MYALLQCDIPAPLFKRWPLSSCLLNLVWPCDLLWPGGRGGDGVVLWRSSRGLAAFSWIAPLRPTHRKPVPANWRVTVYVEENWGGPANSQHQLPDLLVKPSWTFQPSQSPDWLKSMSEHEWARQLQGKNHCQPTDSWEIISCCWCRALCFVLWWFIIPFLNLSTTGIIKWLVLCCGVLPWAMSNIQQPPWPLSPGCQ